MTDVKTHVPLRVERLPDGGFVVSETSFFGGGDPNYRGPVFASTSIGEALAFIAGRLDPAVGLLPPHKLEYWCNVSPIARGSRLDCPGCSGDLSKCEALR